MINRIFHSMLLHMKLMNSPKVRFINFLVTSSISDVIGDIPDSLPARGPAVRQMANHALQMCEGLVYIHEKGYTHRDLKMENVLVSGLQKHYMRDRAWFVCLYGEIIPEL